MFEKIKKWYDMGLWTAAMVQNAVVKGKLTQAQADEIVRGA
ncbi:MAG: XkdX family protein [Oscillospiraceae bacterium]